MSNTRNRNTFGNYQMEKAKDIKRLDWQLNPYGAAGHVYRPAQPGFGLMSGRCSYNTLSSNPVEIESFLFGIGSTNLENPQASLTPQLIRLPFVQIPGILPPVVFTAPPSNLQNQRPSLT